MLDKLRKTIANKIYTANNAMSLGKQFLKYGNKKMYGDWSQTIMRDEDFYTGYGYATILRRANKTAKIAKENLRVESNKEEFIHPYSTIIDTSRKFTNTEFWRVISTYLDLEGIFYLMAVRNVRDEGSVGPVIEFQLLNPFNVQRIVKLDKETGEEVGGFIETKNGMQREIQKELIIPIRELNPFKPNVPFSMADAAKDSQFTLNESNDYTRKAIKGNLNSPGIITTDVILPEKQFDQFVDRVKGAGEGAPIFGNGAGAIKYESMTEQLSKAALKEISDINRETLLAVAGSSKTMMGIEESGTTRDVARLQRDLNTEDHILPRIQLIIDAMNLDYNNNYSEKSGRVSFLVDSPLESDHDSDIKETQVKGDQFELYNDLVNKGYEREIAAQYVDGKISLEDLGEPTNEPVVIALPQDGTDEEDNAIKRESGIVNENEGALQNAVVNIDQQLVAIALSKVQKNQFDDEDEIINKTEKSEIISELELVLLTFYGLTMTLKGGEIMRARVSEFALGGQYKLDKQSKDYIKRISRKVAEGHVDTVLDDILIAAREAALAGESVIGIKRAITKKYSEVITETRAKAIARTETNRAFTRAQFEADRQFIDQNDLGKRAFKQWVTRSDNPCPFCLELEAEGPQPFDQAFRDLGSDVKAGDKTLAVDFEALEAGNAHVNCILPDSVVIAPDVKNITTVHYSGEVVKFTTVSGRSMTVTPNHIMLTSRGWVAAKNILKSDSIISYSRWDEITMRQVDPANNNTPATIEDIFAAAIKNSNMTRSRVPVTTKDFKGDGASSQSDVHIVSTKGFLGDKMNSTFSKFLTNHKFKTADFTGVPLVENGNLSSMLIALGGASDGIMGSDDLSSFLDIGKLTTEQSRRFLDSSNYDTRLSEAAKNNTPGDTEIISELLLGLSSLVTADSITDIKRFTYSGHVYDLSTMTKLYMVNGAITSNCACEYILIIKDAKNSLKRMEQIYDDMDKRTKESKNLLKQLKNDRLELKADKEKFKKKEQKLGKDIKKVDKLLKDHE